MIKRLREIIGELDADIYWKDCNFIINEDSETMPEFYSRDECKNISFKELLLWYLPRLGSWQDEPMCSENECVYNCEKCNHFQNMDNCEDFELDKKIKEMHYNLFLELIDIYAFYKSDDCENIMH